MSRRWIIACTLAEALGIAGVALAYASAGRGLLPEAPAILTAGAWEGACLGTAQAMVLSRHGLRPARWIAVTVALAVLGYAGSLGAGAGGGDPATADPPLAFMLIAAAALGLALGALMGAGQAWAAGGLVPMRGWVLRNMAGWALAMTAIFAGTALAADTWPLAGIALLGGISGAVAGFLLGLVTAPATPA